MKPIEIKSDMLSCPYDQWPVPKEVRRKALRLLKFSVGVLLTLGMEANEIELQEFLEWLPSTSNKITLEAAILAYMRATR